MIKPVGHRVLVKPDGDKSKTDGGIYIPARAVENEQRRTQKGVIVDIGALAWRDFGDGLPWAKIGDRVVFVQHAGFVVEDEDGTYRLMNDEDIVAREGGK